jgi:prepilin-type N-terminal cleavage/methylation domain-containing protein
MGKHPVNRGFSLIEMIIAIFIFSLIMAAVTGAFVSAFSSRNKAKAIQRNIEDARFAMEIMAKTLRTSSVVDYYPSSSITFIDYSQAKNCTKYYLDSYGKLKSIVDYSVVGSDLDTLKTDCRNASFSSGTESIMISGTLNDFSVQADLSDGTPSSKQLGKVTISMTVCADSACQTDSTIQTTVSLRDYVTVN